MSVHGRTALVTGAGGQGMGRSIALTLARDGADVALNYRRSEDRARATAARIEAIGRRTTLAPADITDFDQLAAMFAHVEQALGPVDIVVNVAGAPWKPQDLTEIDPAHLREVLAREVEATYYLLRLALPGMRVRGWGRFISIGGHRADDWTFGPPDAPLDYPLGKAARHWLTRTLAPREHPHGITINAIAPGPTPRFTEDEALAALAALATFDPALDAISRSKAPRAHADSPPSSANTPQHIAEVAAFLCTDAAARITGAVIPVPGATPI